MDDTREKRRGVRWRIQVAFSRYSFAREWVEGATQLESRGKIE
jgi:hypothetical protein